MSRITSALLALGLVALLAPAGAAAAPRFVHLGDFDQPVYAASPPDHGERVFVVEQRGLVHVVTNGALRAAPFLDISDEVRFGAPGEDERGLLSIAFAPDYATSGLFYVYMTAEDPVGELQLREYRRSLSNPDVAGPVGRIVWRQAHDQAANHNGGTLDFGPDGFLWFATGDGGGGNNQFGHARDLNSHLGKMLRIDPRPSGSLGYTVPADNPNPASPVWGYGLRNPFRFSFDHRGTKDLFVGDVGQDVSEEIDWVRFADFVKPAPADFGWSCREGTFIGPDACDPAATYVPPIFDYTQAAPRAVNGGVVVRDPGLPSLVGRYLYADTYTGVVRSFVPASPRAIDERSAGLERLGGLVAFGEDGCGHIYVVSASGVDRIVDGRTGPCVERPTPPPLPPAPPPPPARPLVVDLSSPRVRIGLARRGRVGLRATPRITLTANESCRVTVTARVPRVRFKRVRTPLRAGRRTIVRLRPNRSGARRIRKALRRHRRLTLIVSVTARDAAGNTGRVQRRMKVRRG